MAEAIAHFTPKTIAPPVWARIEGQARAWATAASPRDPDHAKAIISVCAQLLLWAHRQGEPLEAETLLHPESIDRFIHEGCRQKAGGTRQAYRTVLRRTGREMLGTEWFPFSLTMPRQRLTRPYTSIEIAAQASWIRGLPTPHMRRYAMLFFALGVGAGLEAREMERLRGTDVSRDEDGVLIHIDGQPPRSVPVLACFEDAVSDPAEEAGERYVFRSDCVRDGYHPGQFINRCAAAAGSPPAFSLQRLRVTWIATQLVAGVPPNELAKLAGINAVQLAKYFEFLPEADPDQLRRKVREAVVQ